MFVKIPIVYTNGQSTLKVIQKLANEDIKLNITAIFLNQIKEIIPAIKIHQQFYLYLLAVYMIQVLTQN